jgi:hypothetical protein
MEYPLKFDLEINLSTAKSLGLIVPPSIVLQATKVIEDATRFVTQHLS